MMIITLLIAAWLFCGFMGIVIATQELRRDVAPTRISFFFEDWFGFLAVAFGLITLVVAASRYAGLVPLEGRYQKW